MLSALDRTLLDFERDWITPGPKDREIESALGLSAHDYYERLIQLVSDRRAMAYDPLTLKRLSRVLEVSPVSGGIR